MFALLSGLLNGVILATALTCAVWLALRLTPRRNLNAATRYVIWWATLATAVLIPVSFAPLPRLPRRIAPHTISTPPTAIHVPAPVPAVSFTLAAQPPRPVAFPIEVSSKPWPRWPLLLWPAISLFLLFRLALGVILLNRLKARATLAPSVLLPRIDQWLTHCGGVRRGIRLALSDEIVTPIAAGPANPAILIPTHLFEGLADDDLDRIGLHETAHLVRRDDYALIAQRALEALFIPYPLIFWIARRIDLEREIACDDLVIAATGRPRSYAACLTRIVESCAGLESPWPAATAAEDVSQLARRVDALLDKTRRAGAHLMKTRLAASTAVLTSLVLLTGKAPTLIAFVTTTVTTQASRILPPKRMEIAPMPAQAAPDQTESLAGQVVEDSSANPIASAEVRFHRAGLNELAADLETDRQGRFTAPSLPSGEYSVEVVKPNYASTSFHLAVPSARFTVRLVRYGVIDGQAGNAAGQPLAGVIRASGGRTVGSGRITILSKDPATGRLSSFREEALEDSGHYRVFDLPPGQYSVAVWYSGQNEGSGLQLYPDNASPRVFTVTGGEEYDGINFTIAARPTVRISGRIQLPEGVKSQFQLALGLPDQPMLPIAQTLSENDGTFRFDGIPAGSYDLFVGGPITGYGPFFSILGKGDSFFSRARVQSAGQDIEGLSISLSPGKSLHVMVRGKDAGPLPAGCPAGGDISLTPLEPWAIQFASQSAVSFGKEQVISNLAPGLYRARASQLGDRCFQTTDAVADLRGDSPEPVALELAAAGSVHGLLRGDTSGKVVVLMDVRATDGAQARVAYPDAGGRFRFETLPPARYRIAAYPADRNPRSRWVSSEPSGKQQGREIEVGGGVPTEVEISQ